MKQNAGQIFPFCVMIIAMILILVISNFEIGFLNFRKIQQQKKVDGITMHFATDYARALNGLAALNEGLMTIRNRGWIVAATATVLAACSLPQPDKCGKPLAKLSVKLPTFYSRLNKLGETMATQQKEIITWMLQSRCQANTELRLTTFSNMQFYPVFPCSFRSDFHGLPFYRPSEEFGEEINGVEKCRTQTLHSHNRFKDLAENLSTNFHEGSATFKIQYASRFGTKHFEKPKYAHLAKMLPYSMQRRVTDHYENFIFQEASVTSCTRFRDLFGKMNKGVPFVFKIPKPLVFKPEFFTQDNKLILLAADKIKSPFKNVSTSNQLGDLEDKVWGLTETIVTGDDFQKMDFKAEITAVTLQTEVWQAAMRNNPLGDWPNLWKSGDEIQH
jgi:hypothetical protein